MSERIITYPGYKTYPGWGEPVVDGTSVAGPVLGPANDDWAKTYLPRVIAPVAVKIGECVLGQVDQEKNQWWLVECRGLFDEDIRRPSGELYYRDGAWAGRGFYDAKHVEIKVSIGSPAGSRKPPWGAVEFLKRSLPVRTAHKALFKFPGRQVAIDAVLEDKVKVEQVGPERLDVSFGLFAADPRIFAADFETGNLNWTRREIGAIRTGSGLVLPFNAPFTIPIEENEETTARFVVGGSGEAIARLTITGPCTDPVIYDEISGKETRINIRLDPGETLVIDTDRHLVLLGGTSSRRSALQGPWPSLSPGPHSFMWWPKNTDKDTRLTIDYVETLT